MSLPSNIAIVLVMLIIGMGIKFWLDQQLKIRHRITLIELLLIHILEISRKTTRAYMHVEKNEVLFKVSISSRNFLCDCAWPINLPSLEKSDDDTRILRILDGHIGLRWSHTLREQLRILGISHELESTLLFVIEEDSCANEQVRKQHGLFYKTEIKDASGVTTLVAEGILPRTVLEKNKHDKLYQDIFATLEPLVQEQ